MDITVLALRVAVSLAVVLVLVWFLARQARRRGLGRGADGQRFTVVGRHSLGRNAGVTVVRVGDEALVLGVTEQSVQLLARTDLAAVSGAPTPAAAAVTRTVVLPEPAPARAARPVRSAAPQGALAGSALSRATWASALDALREKTTRR